ncbi:hypothetical protein JRG78_10315 [Microbacterium sp. EF45047]|nr:hypothetical protein JSY13_10330 [Microbacterium neungamense]WCM56898.1 hypothetical protein JRG78_10315 [Microbacterium sp. EF45047]
MGQLLSDRACLTSPLPLFTADEARMLGIRLSASAHVAVRRGVYTSRRDYEALTPWQRYAVRVHAYSRTHPHSVLCLESAAVVHGLPLFGESRDIHVYDPDRPSSTRYGDVVVHTSRDDRAVQRTDGILVTALGETAVDLARLLAPAQALAVTDAAISPAQGGMLRLADLREIADGQSTARGTKLLEWVWAHADGRAESPAESVSRAVIEWSGYPEPELQHEFHYEGVRDRVDFYFPGCRAIGEADGWQKYALEDPQTAGKRLADEKRREDRLRRHTHPFARWDLSDAWRVAPMCHALDLAGVPRVRPLQRGMLATLRRRHREVARESVSRARISAQS